jgi:uncharacterized membrane protein YraQ (UPF0718 family)
MNIVSILLEYIVTQFYQIMPYWIFGIVIGSIISVFCKEYITNAMGKVNHKKWGIFGIIPAAILGIISPLCIYGTIPVVAALARKKVPQDWLTAFMVCSILLNPQLFIYTCVLGLPTALLRLFVCFLTGIAAALLVYFFFRKVSFYTFIGFAEHESHDTDPNMFLRLFKNIGRAFRITAPYFLIGIVLTAVYQTFFPIDMAQKIFSWNPGFGVLFAAALGVPLYACGGGSIPLLGAWLEAGMSQGSGVAFMITGQAVKMTNLSAVKIILGGKHFTFYIMYAIMFSIITGLLIDIFI